MHYTYLHLTKDTNKIFYIGKGSGNRAFSDNRRNKYWKNIVAKHGFNADILAYWDSEQDALEHEKVLIACFKDMGYKLANLTDGGQGSSGLKQLDETKQKRSNALKGRKRPEIVEKMRVIKTGFKHSEQTKEKMRKSAIARGYNPINIKLMHEAIQLKKKEIL